MLAVISCMHLKHNRRPTPYPSVLCGVVMGQPSTNDGPTCNNILNIGGFKGEGQGAMPPPKVGPQQVPREAIWRL